ncbi:MAG: hypothetical protein IJ509_02405 [Bacilli bacterium]|nr:hypothetical protein [Bacilli bacterium]
MKEFKGIVKEVFIPNEYKNNQLIDIMYATKIGFKIKLDNDEEITIIKEQDEYNANILKDDEVTIIQEVVDGNYTYDLY